jgi:hypothetical protein
MDTSDSTKAQSESGTINTVANICSNYTNKAYARAVLAHKIQSVNPVQNNTLSIVERNLLCNCTVTHNGIIATEKIFGPDVR